VEQFFAMVVVNRGVMINLRNLRVIVFAQIVPSVFVNAVTLAAIKSEIVA
jgi:hypothetical protein